MRLRTKYLAKRILMNFQTIFIIMQFMVYWGTATLSIVLIAMLLYYYVISNYGSLCKTLYWIAWLFLISLMNFAVCHYIVTQALLDAYSAEIPADYDFDIFLISIVNALWTIIIGYALSTFLKLKARMRHEFLSKN